METELRPASHKYPFILGYLQCGFTKGKNSPAPTSTTFTGSSASSPISRQVGNTSVARRSSAAKRFPPLKGKTRKRKVITESDWLSYHGSNAALKKLVSLHGPDGFRREILHLCRSSGECTYYEAKTQFDHDALVRDDYFNDWIMCRVSRSHVKSLKSLNTPVTQ